MGSAIFRMQGAEGCEGRFGECFDYMDIADAIDQLDLGTGPGLDGLANSPGGAPAKKSQSSLGIYGQIYPFAFRSSLWLRPWELLQAKGYI